VSSAQIPVTGQTITRHCEAAGIGDRKDRLHSENAPYVTSELTSAARLRRVAADRILPV
jgi:hypothetical protein